MVLKDLVGKCVWVTLTRDGQHIRVYWTLKQISPSTFTLEMPNGLVTFNHDQVAQIRPSRNCCGQTDDMAIIELK